MRNPWQDGSADCPAGRWELKGEFHSDPIIPELPKPGAAASNPNIAVIHNLLSPPCGIRGNGKRKPKSKILHRAAEMSLPKSFQTNPSAAPASVGHQIFQNSGSILVGAGTRRAPPQNHIPQGHRQDFPSKPFRKIPFTSCRQLQRNKHCRGLIPKNSHFRHKQNTAEPRICPCWFGTCPAPVLGRISGFSAQREAGPERPPSAPCWHREGTAGRENGEKSGKEEMGRKERRNRG